jgi:subtilisin family serine protease
LLPPGKAPRFADSRGKIPMLLPLSSLDASERSGWLEVAPGLVSRWLDRDEIDTWSRRPGAWVSPPLHTSIDISATQWIQTAAAHAAGHRGSGALIGIVDTGIDLRHKDLRNVDGSSRVAWLLDLSRSPLGIHTDLEHEFGCDDPQQAPCAVLGPDEIKKDMNNIVTGPQSTDTIGHGTHVAGIAASNGGTAGVYIGGAPLADLVVARVTRGASGGSISDTDVVNAARFVFGRADAMGRPIVVNASLGGDFGPHDGTSPLEVGLASFVGANQPGHAMVVAAGNSGGIYTDADASYGVHTEVRVVSGSTAKLPLSAVGGKGQINGSVYIWIEVQPSDELKVGIEVAGKTILDPLGPGEQGGVAEVSGVRPYAGVINGVIGGSSPIAQGSYGAVVVLDGKWDASTAISLLLEGPATAQVWAQSIDGAASGTAAPVGVMLRGGIKPGTINTPATHPDLIAVGCTLNRTTWTSQGKQLPQIAHFGGLENPKPDSACFFSGSGPTATGVPKPEISAPGGYVISSMSADARPDTSFQSIFIAAEGQCPSDIPNCNVVDDTHAVASGTSMSSPQVTGAVALLLEQDPTLTQSEIVALLQAGARRFQGTVPVEVQLGPGALDIEGSLAVLAERGAPRKLAPDATKSWLHLSVDHARPDGGWPVIGTVELRASDGGSADGFDSAKLTLTVETATIAEPLTRIAPGLWRFKLLTAPGTGGDSLRAIVKYDGSTIADRTLPIAPDVWGVRSVPTAGGGCSMAFEASRPRGVTSSTEAALAMLIVAGIATRRVRRVGVSGEG